MYDSQTQVIKKFETPKDESGKYREYSVYQKDGKFVTECIEWQVQSPTRSGGGQLSHDKFDTEVQAVERFEELKVAWEAEA